MCMNIHTHCKFCKAKSHVKRFVFPSGWLRGSHSRTTRSFGASQQSAFPPQETTVSDALSPLSFCFWCTDWGEGHGNTRLDVVSVLGPPADFTVRTNLTSSCRGGWILFRPKGDSEHGKEGQLQTTAVYFILCFSGIYEIRLFSCCLVNALFPCRLLLLCMFPSFSTVKKSFAFLFVTRQQQNNIFLVKIHMFTYFRLLAFCTLSIKVNVRN